MEAMMRESLMGNARSALISGGGVMDFEVDLIRRVLKVLRKSEVTISTALEDQGIDADFYTEAVEIRETIKELEKVLNKTKEGV